MHICKIKLTQNFMAKLIMYYVEKGVLSFCAAHILSSLSFFCQEK